MRYKLLKYLLLQILAISSFINLSFSQCGSLDIQSDQQDGCINEIIKFFVPGTPSGSTYEWKINGKAQNGDDTLTALFENLGTYDIEVEITFQDNSKCYLFKNDYIHITAPEIKKIGTTNSTICYIGDTVSVFANTTNGYDFNWVVDGESYFHSDSIINFSVTDPGYKSALLLVYDKNGCFAQKRVDSIFRLLEPIDINFTDSNDFGCVPRYIHFTPAYDLKGYAPKDYLWTFTGAASVNQNKEFPDSVLYNNAGNFNVSLSVELKNGCKYTRNNAGSVRVGDRGNLSYTVDDSSLCRLGTAEFTNTSTVHSPSGLSWNFGPSPVVLSNSTQNTKYVQYPAGGSYDVSLNYNYNGCSNSFVHNDHIEVNDLRSFFYIINGCNCSSPYFVNFLSSSVLPPSGTYSYLWRYYSEDGNTVIGLDTNQNSFFNFVNPGTHKVSLQVTHHQSGCTDLYTNNSGVTIRPFKPEMEKFPIKNGCVGSQVSFNIPSTITNCSYTPLDYYWIFYELDGVNIRQISTLKSPRITYYQAGKYSYQLIISNGSGGCADTVFYDKEIIIHDIQTDFTFDKTDICAGESISFDESASPVGSYSNTWTFTNLDTNITVSKNSNSNPVSVAFNVPGIYTARVVTSNGYCNNTKIVDSAFRVSGPIADFTTFYSQVCEGDSSSVRAYIKYDKNYSANPDAYQYHWTVTPSSNVIEQPDSQETKIALLNKGCYSVKLEVSNAANCSYEITKSNVLCAGTTANFDIASEVCKGADARATNRSSRGLTYEWTFDTSAIDIYPNNTYSNPIFTFKKSGYYQIKLKSSRQTCADSITKTVYVQKLINDFYAFDSVNYCSPIIVNFAVDAVDANQFCWCAEGAGFKPTTDTHYTYLYLENVGSIDTGFDVSLVAISDIGCTDTFIKKNYLKIVGPVPEFEILNNNGCEPLEVEFIDKSQNVSEYVFFFGDGESVQSQPFDEHTYTVGNDEDTLKVYFPLLISYDDRKCNLKYKKDSIVVYQAPMPDFEVADTLGCEPFTVAFTNLSKFTDSFMWDFESDGIIDDTSQNPVHTFDKGFYSVTLYAQNRNGCWDTIRKDSLIEVYLKPEVSFNAINDDTLVCFNQLVEFRPNIDYAEGAIISYRWDFGDSSEISDTSIAQMPVYGFSQKYSTIQLIVQDEHYCYDTFYRQAYIYAQDSSIPKSAGLWYLTVDNDQDIELFWESYNKIDFIDYQLFRNTGAGDVNIYTSNNISDTTFLDQGGLDVKNDIYKYTMKVRNVCDIFSVEEYHNNIKLQVSSPAHGTNLITWNKYINWSSLSVYELYRKAEDESSFIKIADVNPADTSYIDDELCNKEYCYYLIAKENQNNFQSLSNSACQEPLYLFPEYTYRKMTTVLDEETVRTQWIDSNFASVDYYIIDRMKDNTGNWELDYATRSNPQFDDIDVNPDERFYQYRIWTKDVCGNMQTMSTQTTNSILLDAQIIDKQITLNWNPYPEVISGIMEYEIEQQLMDGTWTKLATVDKNTISYLDDEIYERVNKPLCYRVSAVFQGYPDYNSISNTSCVILPSLLIFPNAFSPNGDGVNDLFEISAQSIYEQTGNKSLDFKIQIYDRYGMLLFESTNFDESWDGTYNGQLMPEGVYFYYIFAIGLNDDNFSRSGTITLIR
jgi:gliding motility-associated-like protein